MEVKDMREENLHVTDDELLLHADGDVRPASGGRIRAHLESCPRCRARLTHLGSTLAEFGEAHRETWKTALPAGTIPRALLKARLAELAVQEREKGWLRSACMAVIEHRHAAVVASLGIAMVLLLAVRPHTLAERSQTMSASLGRWEEPDLRLTPGATVPVTETEVCGGVARTVPAVPVSLKRKVFEEYGVTPPQPDAYEVDYLITPELGGATDIRNLWPEPYQDTVWNAHVKDQLEDRLHRMVCHGDLDLATAQRDISSDWIAAYRKYFHADQPVSDGTSFDFSGLRPSLPRT
jgi:hypothetical protein